MIIHEQVLHSLQMIGLISAQHDLQMLVFYGRQIHYSQTS